MGRAVVSGHAVVGDLVLELARLVDAGDVQEARRSWFRWPDVVAAGVVREIDRHRQRLRGCVGWDDAAVEALVIDALALSPPGTAEVERQLRVVAALADAGGRVG